MGDLVADGKAALRRELLDRRASMTPDALAAGAESLAAVALDRPEVVTASCVAAYVSVGREPGTRGLLDALADRGVLVLVPVLLADGDLDWAAYADGGSLAPATRGLLEPDGPRRGVDAVTRADVVLVPALAVDRHGHRLGRGGGSYDRALTRRSPATLVVALLHDGELLDGRDVPVDRHDRPVDAVAQPGGFTDLR